MDPIRLEFSSEIPYLSFAQSKGSSSVPKGRVCRTAYITIGMLHHPLDPRKWLIADYIFRCLPGGRYAYIVVELHSLIPSKRGKSQSPSLYLSMTQVGHGTTANQKGAKLSGGENQKVVCNG